MMKLLVWDSEDDEASIDIADDRCSYPWFVKLDAENGLLRLCDYEVNGMHTTSVLFVGPKAEENAEKWDDAVAAEGEEGLDYNVDTEKLIEKCFGLG